MSKSKIVISTIGLFSINQIYFFNLNRKSIDKFMINLDTRETYQQITPMRTNIVVSKTLNSAMLSLYFIYNCIGLTDQNAKYDGKTNIDNNTMILTKNPYPRKINN
jgi:hypothetical protein